MEGVGGDGRGGRKKPSRGRRSWLTPTISTASARPQRWKPLDQDYEVFKRWTSLAMCFLITLICFRPRLHTDRRWRWGERRGSTWATRRRNCSSRSGWPSRSSGRWASCHSCRPRLCHSSRGIRSRGLCSGLAPSWIQPSISRGWVVDYIIFDNIMSIIIFCWNGSISLIFG